MIGTFYIFVTEPLTSHFRQNECFIFQIELQERVLPRGIKKFSCANEY